MSEHDVRPAVAAVVAGNGRVRGTAFFVGPDVAVTCDHVVQAAGERELSLRPVGSTATAPVTGMVRDPDLDLALLRVEELPGRAILRMDPDLRSLGMIESYGFPRDQLAIWPHGVPMQPATVSGRASARWEKRDVDALVINTAVTQGMSGAPAVDSQGGAVVGVLRFSQSGEQRALAVPAEVAVDRWPALRVAAGAPGPTFAEVSSSKIPAQMDRTKWVEFRPEALHCVVVDSEGLASGAGPERLGELVQQTLRNPTSGRDIWAAFTEARRPTALVGGGHRDLPAGYQRKNLECATFTVLDAFASQDSLDLAVRLLVEADLAFFDVTRFEPGVMLLLGVRAATRRGVTIASHGAGWKEGDWHRPGNAESADLTRLYRPFNLSDISLSSHSPRDPESGKDPRIARLAERVSTGFAQLARRPSYRDLPVYDALRQLGPGKEAWSSIGLKQEVLVLCSYAASFFPTWNATLRPRLEAALWDKDIPTTVHRLQDIATPQVVSQSLYERIRRCAACVADWTDSSPSTFFELGVRMTVSRWDVVQIAKADWLRDQLEPAEGVLRQIAAMDRLLKPLTYVDGPASDVGVRIADQLAHLIERSGGSSGHRVRRVAAASIGAVEDRLPDVHDQLRAEADALSIADEEQNVPQTLFYEVDDIKRDHERSARERRLAAWLYLEHRVGAARLAPTDPRHGLWQKLGAITAADLLRTRVEADIFLAMSIDVQLAVDATHRAKLLRNRGEALRSAGREDEAKDSFRRAVAVLDDELADLLQAVGMPTDDGSRAADIADLYGRRGGLYDRLDELRRALESYQAGADIETGAGLVSTYNRTNVFKLAIRAGVETHADLDDGLVALRRLQEELVTTDEQATDSAWLWADLGDVRLLLGDDLPAAEAYQSFTNKAKSGDLASTLSNIREVVDALAAHQDPAAERVAETLDYVTRVLGAR